MQNNPTWTPVVALALLGPDGRWLMHKRPPDKHHGGLWEFPGGKVEKGETPAFALLREIREELDLALKEEDLKPAGFAQEPHGARDAPIVILLYTCAEWSGEPRALEGGEVGWFAPDEIAGLEKPPLDVALAAQLFRENA